MKTENIHDNDIVDTAVSAGSSTTLVAVKIKIAKTLNGRDSREVGKERGLILRGHGAKFHWSDPMDSLDGAVRLTERIQAASLSAGTSERGLYPLEFQN